MAIRGLTGNNDIDALRNKPRTFQLEHPMMGFPLYSKNKEICHERVSRPGKDYEACTLSIISLKSREYLKFVSDKDKAERQRDSIKGRRRSQVPEVKSMIDELDDGLRAAAHLIRGIGGIYKEDGTPFDGGKIEDCIELLTSVPEFGDQIITEADDDEAFFTASRGKSPSSPPSGDT